MNEKCVLSSTSDELAEAEDIEESAVIQEG
jgi:hypothetical protein